MKRILLKAKEKSYARALRFLNEHIKMTKSLLLLSILLLPVACAKELVIEELPMPEFMGSDGSFYAQQATSYPKITQVEQTLFRKDFAAEPIEMRLKRLETKMFNRSYDGYPLSQRTDGVLAAAQELSVDKNAIAALEKAILYKNFNSDTPSNRIARLEQSVFGAVQGGELNDRVRTLRTAADSYSMYNNPNPLKNPVMADNIINSIPTKTRQGNMLKNALGSVASFFMSGNPTGWTPQVQPQEIPYPTFSQSPYSQYLAPTQNQYRPYQAYQQPYQQTYQQPYQSPLQNPYQPQFRSQYPGYKQSTPQYVDLFSSGGSGSETYYDDGQYRKGFSNSQGGAMVTILR